MRNKCAAVVLALAPLLAVAQNAEPAKPAAESTKVIHVRYARAEAVASLFGSSSVTGNNGLKALIVRGSAAFIQSIEASVKELDVPSPDELPRDVELTIYVVGAGAKGGPQGAPAAEIEPVVRQLKAVFPYGGYQLLDSIMVRSREGRSARTGGLLKNFPDPQVSFLNRYNIDCDLDTRPEDGSDRTIRIRKFSFSTGVPNSEIRVSLETNLDLQDGQKVVVGNTNIDGGNSALFVVVSAKFVP